MSSRADRVGIVVLNYRGTADTMACVQSLAELDVPARVVVVDNGSQDGSAETLSGVVGIELILNDSNVGFAAGNNIAISRLLADGLEFVWVLNNDTTVERTTLTELLAVAEAAPRAGAIGSAIYDMARPDRVLTLGGGSLGRWTGRTTDARRAGDKVDYITAASMLLRGDALRDVGMFDQRYFFTWEDVELCTRLVRHGWSLAVAERARVWHRWGGTLAPLAPLRLREHAAGLVVYMRSHSPAPWLTTVPMLGYYAVTAARQRRLELWRAAWRGWRDGWRR
jgi:alpha-1,3-rhamnosyl/mannosyltransferase